MGKEQRISEVIAGGCLAGMIAQAKRSAELSAVIRTALPDWIDFREIVVAVGPAQQVWIDAPPAIAGLLRQILPVLKERVREMGYQQIRQGRLRGVPSQKLASD